MTRSEVRALRYRELVLKRELQAKLEGAELDGISTTAIARDMQVSAAKARELRSVLSFMTT